MWDSLEGGIAGAKTLPPSALAPKSLGPLVAVQTLWHHPPPAANSTDGNRGVNSDYNNLPNTGTLATIMEWRRRGTVYRGEHDTTQKRGTAR